MFTSHFSQNVLMNNGYGLDGFTYISNENCNLHSRLFSQCDDRYTRFIKYTRLEWLGHARQLDDSRTTETIADWKPTGRRLRGRPRKRFICDIEDDLRSMNVRVCRRLYAERV